MTSYFHSGCSDLDEIRQSDAEWHADTAKWSSVESSCMCGGIRRTLHATIVTIFSHMTSDISVLCQTWHDF